jgi:hypothetical protein
MPQEIDPQHSDIRDLLRVVGPLVVGVGLIFTIIGMVSFFSAFGGGGVPSQFWCAFVGLPLLGIGAGICKFAYIGAVTRYIADEVAPVGKDVVNYMADGTKDSVRDMATAVSEGIIAGSQNHHHVARAEGVVCPKCDRLNDAEAAFCKYCGETLSRTLVCPHCNKQNDPDARFCNHCGKALE